MDTEESEMKFVVWRGTNRRNISKPIKHLDIGLDRNN